LASGGPQANPCKTIISEATKLPFCLVGHRLDEPITSSSITRISHDFCLANF
jgi:hypothetical protein